MGLFLLVRAPVDQGRAGHHQAQGVGKTRRVSLGHFLVVDEHLHQTRPAAAILFGPVDADPAVLGGGLLPGALILKAGVDIDIVKVLGS